MTDPTFQTRAEMLDWTIQLARANTHCRVNNLRALKKIRRVTLAHSHLFEEGK